MATTPAAAGRVRRAYPAPVRDGDDAFVPLAARIGAVAARHAAEHDRDATFVAPAYRAMREHGYLRLPVPAELGGLGASLRQVCYAQAELGRHDGAAALAVSMHLHSTLTQAYLHERGASGAGQVLRRIVSGDLVIATSGGSDWLWPDTVATVEDDGSLRVSGRKVFCSQAPEAGAVSTCAVLGRPGPGAEVAHFSVPLPSPGVRLEETWDTLGMRGTASHDLVFDDVRVPAEAIVATRPWGEFGEVLTTAEVHFAPVVAATYLGIAAQARDVARTRALARAKGGTAPPTAQRPAGLMDARLRTAWWSLTGALDDLGPRYACTPDTLATVMIAKREAVLAAVEVVGLAMDLAGGGSYFRRSPLERACRDVRAGTFHPLTPEATLLYAGKLALGDPGLTE
ncbi:acyl-CoA dehydrogenase [Nonomuraea sp. PA05]|uniref:acyl-CoA dehydrogenase family protein n=1 Tax=Nonomuraea sp. PA05 TaxID=2604466 RepID=UPI0011D8F0D8|nr:acyl-CoA dehydrogenase family protein [Nonomuraea sp. PA05]TYB70271.1 acyl-CoA dehydrogenase [Nonomuraea sp. PA05]